MAHGGDADLSYHYCVQSTCYHCYECPVSKYHGDGLQSLHSANNAAVNWLGGTAMNAFTTTRLLHTFNGPLFGTTRVSRYQKGKTEAGDSEWQWHQLGLMQVCTSLQRDNQASTPHSNN